MRRTSSPPTRSSQGLSKRRTAADSINARPVKLIVLVVLRVVQIFRLGRMPIGSNVAKNPAVAPG